jgi:hypothetical protein
MAPAFDARRPRVRALGFWDVVRQPVVIFLTSWSPAFPCRTAHFGLAVFRFYISDLSARDMIVPLDSPGRRPLSGLPAA